MRHESEPQRFAGDPPDVWVTDHAQKRIQSRFGGRLIVPYRMIQKVGLRKSVGQDYLVRRQSAVFVCKRLSESVAVKTVLVHGAVVAIDGSLIRPT